MADLPLRIAHLASLHCGELTFDPALMQATIERINAIRPDLVVVAGDLTAGGYAWEYDEALAWLERLDGPVVVVPGNHDARNVGYIHFEERCGERYRTHRIVFEGERAERLQASGVTVVAADSSEPDLDNGHIGRERYDWIRAQFAHPEDVKVFVIHHHLIAVPGAGREMNVITDAGDLLPVLTTADVDIAMSGHKHVPCFWGLNGMLVANAGTAANRRLRGAVPPSWNEFQVDASTIKVYLHYPDGRRELSVIRSRLARARIREAFLITGAFIDRNHVLVR